MDWVAIAVNGSIDGSSDFYAQPVWVPGKIDGTFGAPILIGDPFRGNDRVGRSETLGSTFAVGDLNRDGFFDLVVRVIVFSFLGSFF